MTDPFTLHPQLDADCHSLGSLAVTRLLLHKNAQLPWFILVPETHGSDFLSLDESLRAQVVNDCSLIADYVRSELGYPKINFASIGNMVPQLHMHVVGRKEGDACWPQPVWGNLPAGPAYTENAIEEIKISLSQGYGLTLY